MSGASVAVIGGGVIGASVAYHLARRGWRDVVVLDRGPAAGGGSTGRATGEPMCSVSAPPGDAVTEMESAPVTIRTDPGSARAVAAAAVPVPKSGM